MSINSYRNDLTNLQARGADLWKYGARITRWNRCVQCGVSAGHTFIFLGKKKKRIQSLVPRTERKRETKGKNEKETRRQHRRLCLLYLFIHLFLYFGHSFFNIFNMPYHYSFSFFLWIHTFQFQERAPLAKTGKQTGSDILNLKCSRHELTFLKVSRFTESVEAVSKSEAMCLYQ